MPKLWSKGSVNAFFRFIYAGRLTLKFKIAAMLQNTFEMLKPYEMANNNIALRHKELYTRTTYSVLKYSNNKLPYKENHP